MWHFFKILQKRKGDVGEMVASSISLFFLKESMNKIIDRYYEEKNFNPKLVWARWTHQCIVIYLSVSADVTEASAFSYLLVMIP